MSAGGAARPDLPPRLRLDSILPPKVVELIDQLVETELYGEDREEAIERLVCRALERPLASGLIVQRRDGEAGS